jgi:hypothetical protein
MPLNKLELLKLFKDKTVEFLDALIEKLPKERDLYMVRVLFETQIPVEKAMQIFSSRILPHEEYILNKDERFIFDCNDLFEGIKKDKVSYFKEIWVSPTFTTDDKDQLWKWFQLFLKMAKLYSEF